jgi:ferredoxin
VQTMPTERPIQVAVVDNSRCTHCGICTDVCPVSAIHFSNDETSINHELCVGCGQCVRTCPKDAIRLIERL